MGALGDGVDQDLDHRLRLCKLLGLDPDETTEIRVVIEAGTGAVVEWTGKRRVPLAKIAAAFADVFDDPDPAPARPGGMSEWSIGADPFTPRCGARIPSAQFVPGVWLDHEHVCTQHGAEHQCACGASWTYADDEEPPC